MNDRDNRDVNEINSHVMVLFEDVIAEPEGVRSSGCVWSLSRSCFGGCKGCFYKLYSLLCGCITTALWGCVFGNIAFCHVWCATPLLRAVEMNCAVIRKIVKMCFGCCCDPYHESVGLIFEAFRRS